MPRATVRIETERFDLRTVPATDNEEGGWVELRPLPYDKILERQDRSSRMWTEGQQRRRRGRLTRDSQPDEPNRLNMDIMQKEARKFEFSHCVVDHNLEDEFGAKLDFSSRGVEITLTILDPKVGEEIAQLIDDMNLLESDEDKADFQKGFGPSSKETPTDSTPDSLIPANDGS